MRAFILLIIVVGLWQLLPDKESSTQSPRAKETKTAQEVAAEKQLREITQQMRTNCRLAVKDRLKFPNESKFKQINTFKGTTIDTPDGEQQVYVVKGSIEAPNKLGKTVQSSFSCIFNEREGKVTRTSITID
ncbi:hypothetical protein [Paraferrimonas haliotis]|uniref:Uncharacterized protein n=1 Tax=Paraferrimonas haliotis TaxID=2013866 RepID=A0AA37TY41_9GAMM|nr:hypothetical protein [Paraferrimonas haliotis]GLS83441.1 hypothetical protein GCM10007894_14180 [Paraferrimonas haliotis]